MKKLIVWHTIITAIVLAIFFATFRGGNAIKGVLLLTLATSIIIAIISTIASKGKLVPVADIAAVGFIIPYYANNFLCVFIVLFSVALIIFCLISIAHFFNTVQKEKKWFINVCQFIATLVPILMALQS